MTKTGLNLFVLYYGIFRVGWFFVICSFEIRIMTKTGFGLLYYDILRVILLLESIV